MEQASPLDRYVGVYQLQDNKELKLHVLSEDGQLYVKLSDQDYWKVYPSQDTGIFSYELIPTQFEFLANHMNIIYQVTVHQDGQTAQFQKIDEAPIKLDEIKATGIRKEILFFAALFLALAIGLILYTLS